MLASIYFFQYWFISECAMKNFVKFQLDVMMDGRKEFFLWDVEELMFLINA